MKIWKLMLISAVLLALYLNTGWAVGTFYHNNVLTKATEELSGLAYVAAGASGFLAVGPRYSASLLMSQVIFSVCWPFFLALSLGTWVVCGMYWILYFIFVGGLANPPALG
ncbi:hypothetical protein KKB69_00060 [Patescibacteria group bacterium]|nr:hypothetical protein [Patescibacteria group bacterium]